MFSRILCCFSICASIIGMLIFWPGATTVHADGGAPNRAYVAGASKGVGVIDVSQQKVIDSISVADDPHMILLSLDGRFLYATEPHAGSVAVISALTGDVFCTVKIPGQPTLLALDANTNALYIAGNGASTVTSIDPSNCHIKHTFQVSGAVQGLAVANVGTSLSADSGNQLWVADTNSLTVFDDVKGQQVGQVAVPDGPRYLSIPPGATVYATTRQGSVIAISLNKYTITPLISGGDYGPMDFDETTGEVYVPDRQHNQLVVLNPVNAGITVPKEPSRVIALGAGVVPESIAITSDGQLGFAALDGGSVAMIDIPGRQIINTINVGGNPRFVITGLNPPAVGTTPPQAVFYQTIISIGAYVIVIALLIVPILLFRRYAKAKATNEVMPGARDTDDDGLVQEHEPREPKKSRDSLFE